MEHPWIDKRYQYDDHGILSAIEEEPSRGEFVTQNFSYDASGQLVEWIEPEVGSSRVDLQACKLEYSIVSPK